MKVEDKPLERSETKCQIQSEILKDELTRSSYKPFTQAEDLLKANQERNLSRQSTLSEDKE